MKCGFSREILALYVEDDLASPDAMQKVAVHVAACAECRQYCEQLTVSQAFIKSRFEWSRQEPVNQEIFARMRRNVMSQIPAIQANLSWTVRLERFLTLGFRRHRYAAAGFALAAIVSASLLGQIRRPVEEKATAVFGAMNTLVRPTAYREWVLAGSSQMYHNVYINPAAYREYARAGRFPEGTVMVLEMLPAGKEREPGFHGTDSEDSMRLEVSVKDSSRFDGGWGFYDFSDATGTLKPQANPLPQTAGCIGCHRDKAATDHVFTQFYPVLKFNGGSRNPTDEL